MRTIEVTSQFKQDFKRETKGLHRDTLQQDLPKIVQRLASESLLAHNYRDHAITGEWKDHRKCHVKPDLVLIYRRPVAETLQLVRLGSRSELGL